MLRETLGILNLSQLEFASFLGVSAPTFSLWINGRRGLPKPVGMLAQSIHRLVKRGLEYSHDGLFPLPFGMDFHQRSMSRESAGVILMKYGIIVLQEAIFQTIDEVAFQHTLGRGGRR